ncbi:hypothetical protein RFI_37522, partial [Reticulomyxa filosa]
VSTFFFIVLYITILKRTFNNLSCFYYKQVPNSWLIHYFNFFQNSFYQLFPFSLSIIRKEKQKKKKCFDNHYLVMLNSGHFIHRTHLAQVIQLIVDYTFHRAFHTHSIPTVTINTKKKKSKNILKRVTTYELLVKTSALANVYAFYFIKESVISIQNNKKAIILRSAFGFSCCVVLYKKLINTLCLFSWQESKLINDFLEFKFTKLDERDSSWDSLKPGHYYFTRNQSTIVAFSIPAKYQKGNGFTIMAGLCFLLLIHKFFFLGNHTNRNQYIF